jgi:hypothetical protein
MARAKTIYQGYWLEIELITGHRFEAKRDVNGDDIGVLVLGLQHQPGGCSRSWAELFTR